MAKFKIYKDANGDLQWRFQANNGKILAESVEGYNNRANCEHAIILIKQQVANAPISDEAESDSLTAAGREA